MPAAIAHSVIKRSVNRSPLPQAGLKWERPVRSERNHFTAFSEPFSFTDGADDVWFGKLCASMYPAKASHYELYNFGSRMKPPYWQCGCYFLTDGRAAHAGLEKNHDVAFYRKLSETQQAAERALYELGNDNNQPRQRTATYLWVSAVSLNNGIDWWGDYDEANQPKGKWRNLTAATEQAIAEAVSPNELTDWFLHADHRFGKPHKTQRLPNKENR